jgi:hypothetical protein
MMKSTFSCKIIEHISDTKKGEKIAKHFKFSIIFLKFFHIYKGLLQVGEQERTIFLKERADIFIGSVFYCSDRIQENHTLRLYFHSLEFLLSSKKTHRNSNLFSQKKKGKYKEGKRNNSLVLRNWEIKKSKVL